jgi:hypothetical protein
MTDMICVEIPEGRVLVTVQTKSLEAHARLSERAETWKTARAGIQLLVAGVLKEPQP